MVHPRSAGHDGALSPTVYRRTHPRWGGLVHGSLISAAAAVLVAIVSLSGGCADLADIDGSRCDNAHPCPEPWFCVSGRCQKLGGGPLDCTRDEDCTLGVCLVDPGFCVQCVADAHCAQGICLDGLYQCGCQVGGHCVTGRCTIAPTKTVGYCTSCYSDEQCESGDCNESTGICKKVQRNGSAR